jgi:hypothetical protein
MYQNASLRCERDDSTTPCRAAQFVKMQSVRDEISPPPSFPQTTTTTATTLHLTVHS